MLGKLARVIVIAGIAWFGLRGVVPELARAGWLDGVANEIWTLFAAVMICGSGVWLFLSLLKFSDRMRDRKRKIAANERG